jgi:RNA polymerase sigma factor (sigma-70 family)
MSELKDDRFLTLYESARPLIIAYTLRRAPSREDAADAVAETFEIAWRRLGDIPDGHDSILWLYVTARYVLANQGRRLRRRQEVTTRLSEELHGIELHEAAPDEEGVFMQRSFRALTADERELLMLAGWEGLNAADMGRVLGCSPTAARIRLHRARTRLKAEMAGMAETTRREKRSVPTRHERDSGYLTSGNPEEVLE